VPAREIPALLAAADALAYAGHAVLLSGVVVLALGAGLPLVLPRSGVLADYVPEAGAAWYEPEEPGALERALAEIRGRDLEAMRRANRAAGEALSWEEAGERMAGLYGRLGRAKTAGTRPGVGGM
jgi:glycosyltransferase involved in cell wall biosynthesis